jgi:HEAT repeat protein
LISALGCKATSFFARKHYSKPSIDSAAAALAAIRESSDPALRRAAFEYLGDPAHLGTDDRDEVSNIMGLAVTSEPHAQTRIVILQSLSRLGSPNRWEPIAAALNDKEPAVRACACRLIGKSGRTDVVPMLDQLLLNDSNLDVRLAAADALGNVSTRDAAMALLSGVADADVAVRYRCRQSLQHIMGKDHAADVDEWRKEIQTANFEELAGQKRFLGLTW